MAVRQSGLRRDRDVRGLQSLRTFDHIELHLRAFLQRAEAAGLNRAEVDELILAPVSRNEAKAFRIVEPLDGSGLTTHLRILVKGLVTGQQENFSEKFILSWKERRKAFVVLEDEKLTCVSGTRIGDARLRQVVLTSRRNLFHARRCLEPGSGQEAFLPELPSPFSELHCEGSTHRGQTDKGK